MENPKTESKWCCGGCGDEIDERTTAAHHGGVGYCRGCADAPSEPPEPEEQPTGVVTGRYLERVGLAWHRGILEE